MYNDERVCTNCSKSKRSSDFYTKGKRIDSKCKECVKKRKSKTYFKRKKMFELKKSNLIQESYLLKNSSSNLNNFLYELPVIESILEKLFYNLNINSRNK